MSKSIFPVVVDGAAGFRHFAPSAIQRMPCTVVRGGNRFSAGQKHFPGYQGTRMGSETVLDQEKSVPKVIRVNNRWIVRGNLRANANAYIEHLQATDPDRLVRSCDLAMNMVRDRYLASDPKPLFYSGLFALSTPAEMELYLKEHTLTYAVTLLGHGDSSARDRLGIGVRALVDMIAGKLAEARA